MEKPHNTLRIEGQTLDCDAFYRRIQLADASPAKELLLSIQAADNAEGTPHRLKALLESKLRTGTTPHSLTLQLPAFAAPHTEGLLQASEPTGFRPAAHYHQYTPTRRAFLGTMAAAGTAAALIPHPSSQPPPPTAEVEATAAQAGALPQTEPLTTALSAVLPPLAKGAIGASLGYAILHYATSPRYTLATETTRRSLLGADYAQKPLDSPHAAENLLNILNNFLPQQAQAIRR